MNKRILLLLLLAAAAAGALWYGFIARENDSAALELNGHVDIRSVTLSFRVTGRLAELSVDEGDAVSAGQPLGALDSEPYRLELQRAEAAVAAAERAVPRAEAQAAAAAAELELRRNGTRAEVLEQCRARAAAQEATTAHARREEQRLLGLFAQQAVSEQDRDAAVKQARVQEAALVECRAALQEAEAGFRREEIDAAEAQYAAAQAAVEEARSALQSARAEQAQAQLRLADCTLTAPAAGIVMTRAVEPGSMLAAGSGVLTLSIRHPVWVRAYIDEPLLDRVPLGRRVRLVTDGGREFSGRVGFVSPQAEFTPKTVETVEIRTALVYRLRIIVDEPCEGLNQGAPVRVLVDD
ncbi:MAG: efflux RND transporter periplasmic adaptor subunit [Akkermansia sp.]